MKHDELLEEIRRHARDHRLSATAMARLIGVPESTYRGWFKDVGKTAPSPESVIKIRRFLFEYASDTATQTETADLPLSAEKGTGTKANAGRFENAHLSLGNARHRAARIRKLLILLERELSGFRDGPASAREVFREELDADDVGYISSLLTMLGEERKFARWRDLTTNRFQGFAKKQKKGG